MKTPHLLLAAGNCKKLRHNLTHLLDAAGLAAIDAEILRNVRALLDLGANHYRLAARLPTPQWRHAISRYYYAAYNTGRGVRLFVEGAYFTDSSDHQKVGKLPADFPNLNTYETQLSLLRDNRNLCDYDHTVVTADLVLSRRDTRQLVNDFMTDATRYLRHKGVAI